MRSSWLRWASLDCLSFSSLIFTMYSRSNHLPLGLTMWADGEEESVLVAIEGTLAPALLGGTRGWPI